jgi:multidrug efflux pump subunit AcrA (membrane-fusion protein)
LPEKAYPGEVVFVDPTLQSRLNATYVSALVELDLIETGWAGLPLSSAASVELIAGETVNAVLLPLEGLQEDLGDHGSVFIKDEGGKLIPREVELGLRDVLFVEVTSGLEAGDVVLIGQSK